MTQRVVFDTSSLIGAAIRPLSIPDQAVTLALAAYRLCSSSAALEELHKVLQRPRFDSYVGLNSRLAFLETISTNAELHVVTVLMMHEVKGLCRDGSDDFVLALTIASGADIIVSSDHDLLVLSPWRGIPILTPAEFVKQYSLREDLP